MSTGNIASGPHTRLWSYFTDFKMPLSHPHYWNASYNWWHIREQGAQHTHTQSSRAFGLGYCSLFCPNASKPRFRWVGTSVQTAEGGQSRGSFLPWGHDPAWKWGCATDAASGSHRHSQQRAITEHPRTPFLRETCNPHQICNKRHYFCLKCWYFSRIELNNVFYHLSQELTAIFKSSNKHLAVAILT